MRSIQLALLSCWNHYHASGFVRDVSGMEQVQIVALWDEDASRGVTYAEQFNTVFEPELDKLLARTDIDGVIIDCAPEHAADLIIASARAGKSIIADQVLALTTEDAQRAAQAVEQAGVLFTLDMSLTRWPVNQAAKEVLQSGMLGDIMSVRIRNAHAGATKSTWPEHFRENSYGVFTDLGVHCLYLTGWLLGTPSQMTAMTSTMTTGTAEDNAACIMKYENGTLAICDTSHVVNQSPFSIELYGTQGSFLGGGINGVHHKLIKPEDARIRLYRVAEDGAVNDTFSTTSNTPGEAADSYPMTAVYEPSIQAWARALQGDSSAAASLSGIEEGLRLAKILEALYSSARTERTLPLR